MTEAGIGRILVASLHQGIADVLPTRLEFYENWLNPDGLRHGTIGLAPLNAVLSFLRQEGKAYEQICAQAGAYAAEWSAGEQWRVTRSCVQALPAWLRARVALRLARRVLRRTYVGTRPVVKLRRGLGTIDVRGSLFCNTRGAAPEPLCGFYAATVARYLELYRVPADVRVGRCHAMGEPSCVLTLAVNRQAVTVVDSEAEA
jgi:hypothetical protein